MKKKNYENTEYIKLIKNMPTYISSKWKPVFEETFLRLAYELQFSTKELENILQNITFSSIDVYFANASNFDSCDTLGKVYVKRVYNDDGAENKCYIALNANETKKIAMEQDVDKAIADVLSEFSHELLHIFLDKLHPTAFDELALESLNARLWQNFDLKKNKYRIEPLSYTKFNFVFNILATLSDTRETDMLKSSINEPYSVIKNPCHAQIIDSLNMLNEAFYENPEKNMPVNSQLVIKALNLIYDSAATNLHQEIDKNELDMLYKTNKIESLMSNAIASYVSSNVLTNEDVSATLKDYQIKSIKLNLKEIDSQYETYETDMILKEYGEEIWDNTKIINYMKEQFANELKLTQRDIFLGRIKSEQTNSTCNKKELSDKPERLLNLEQHSTFHENAGENYP